MDQITESNNNLRTLLWMGLIALIALVYQLVISAAVVEQYNYLEEIEYNESLTKEQKARKKGFEQFKKLNGR